MSESSNLVSLSERTPNRPPAIGERLRITLVEPLRSQRTFAAIAELIDQIRVDGDAAEVTVLE